jgi:alpha-glucosidase (family GH31 glycosyl hydrolase)
MAKVSEESLVSGNPERRSYVLTRSAKVGTFKYSCATWTGDKETRAVNSLLPRLCSPEAGIPSEAPRGSS